MKKTNNFWCIYLLQKYSKASFIRKTEIFENYVLFFFIYYFSLYLHNYKIKKKNIVMRFQLKKNCDFSLTFSLIYVNPI